MVLYSSKYNEILLIEGKKLSTIQDGIEEIEDYDSIENEYIKINYPEYKIYRYLSVYGGNLQNIPNEKALFYLTDDGLIYINDNAPLLIKNSNFKEVIYS